MNVQLSKGFAGTYELGPVSERRAKELEDRTGFETVFFQTDWDFPCLARTLGWNGKIGRERCQHSGTDGTVTCPDCGKTAPEFIAATVDWLDRHDGHVFRGKGAEYFDL